MYFAIVDEHGVGSATRRSGQDASVIPHILPGGLRSLSRSQACPAEDIRVALGLRPSRKALVASHRFLAGVSQSPADTKLRRRNAHQVHCVAGVRETPLRGP